jgi:hypothetical protein
MQKRKFPYLTSKEEEFLNENQPTFLKKEIEEYRELISHLEETVVNLNNFPAFLEELDKKHGKVNLKGIAMKNWNLEKKNLTEYKKYKENFDTRLAITTKINKLEKNLDKVDMLEKFSGEEIDNKVYDTLKYLLKRRKTMSLDNGKVKITCPVFFDKKENKVVNTFDPFQVFVGKNNKNETLFVVYQEKLGTRDAFIDNKKSYISYRNNYKLNMSIFDNAENICKNSDFKNGMVNEALEEMKYTENIEMVNNTKKITKLTF